MNEKVLIEAESIDEAREQIKLHLTPGTQVRSEETLQDGRPVSIGGEGDTTDSAFAELEEQVPSDAHVSKRQVVRQPGQRTIVVEAFDEQTARESVTREKQEYERIEGIELLTEGKKGILGIGKKPNRYQARVANKAHVQVTWQGTAQVRFTIGPKDLLGLVKRGDRETIEAALEAGAALEVQDEGGYTPLMWAAFDGEAEILELLIAKGANVDAATSWGATALTRAAQDGETRIVELLLAGGANVDQTEYDGYTALSRAAMNGHEQIVQLLLTKGANQNIRTKHGLTALALAQQGHHAGVVKLFQERHESAVEQDWSSFFQQLATNNAKSRVPPQVLLCCQLLSMATRLAQGLPPSTNALLVDQPGIVEFADGQAAVRFPLRDGKDILPFVSLLGQGNYGTESLIIKSGVAAGLPVADRQPLRQALGIPQLLFFASAGEQVGQESFVWW